MELRSQRAKHRDESVTALWGSSSRPLVGLCSANTVQKPTRHRPRPACTVPVLLLGHESASVAARHNSAIHERRRAQACFAFALHHQPPLPQPHCSCGMQLQVSSARRSQPCVDMLHLRPSCSSHQHSCPTIHTMLPHGPMSQDVPCCYYPMQESFLLTHQLLQQRQPATRRVWHTSATTSHDSARLTKLNAHSDFCSVHDPQYLRGTAASGSPVHTSTVLYSWVALTRSKGRVIMASRAPFCLYCHWHGRTYNNVAD